MPSKAGRVFYFYFLTVVWDELNLGSASHEEGSKVQQNVTSALQKNEYIALPIDYTDMPNSCFF